MSDVLSYEELQKLGAQPIEERDTVDYDTLVQAGAKPHADDGRDADWGDAKSGPHPTPGRAATAARGFASAAFGDHDDELMGLLGAANPALNEEVSLDSAKRLLFQPRPEGKFWDRYDAIRDQKRAVNKAGGEAHPGFDLWGKIRGSEALPVPGGPGLKGALKTGGAAGVIYGAGASEAPTLAGTAADALKGLASGTATSMALYGLGKGVGAIGSAIKNRGQKTVDSLIGPVRQASVDRAEDKAIKKIFNDADRSEAARAKVRQAALDEFVKRSSQAPKPDRTAAELAKIQDELAALERSKQGRLGQAYQSAYQAEHVYGPHVPDEKLPAEALARRQDLQKKMPEVAVRRLLDPTPEQIVEAEYAEKLKAALARKAQLEAAAARPPPSPDDIAAAMMPKPADPAMAAKAEEVAAARLAAMEKAGKVPPAVERPVDHFAAKDQAAKLVQPRPGRFDATFVSRDLKDPRLARELLKTDDQLAEKLPTFGSTSPFMKAATGFGIPSAAAGFKGTQAHYAMGKALAGRGRDLAAGAETIAPAGTKAVQSALTPEQRALVAEWLMKLKE